MNTVVRGNLMGIGALLLWCTLVGMIRSITEEVGVAGGTAVIYSIGVLATSLRNGLPNPKKIPKMYLLAAGFFFVAYEILLSQGIGMSESPRQALEVGMLNYLWPGLTIVFSIAILKTKLRWYVWPGIALSLLGMYWCLAANGGLDIGGFLDNLRATPLPYLFGFGAGISWALYSNLSVRYANDANAVSWFFIVIAILLWSNFFMRGEELRFPGYWFLLQLVFLGVILGFSYSLWETGIHKGNFIFLAVCSYFTPAASMLFAGALLQAMPPLGFWAGVGLVIGGSLICWAASLHKPMPKAN